MDVVAGILGLEGSVGEFLHATGGGKGDPGLRVELAEGDPLGPLRGGQESGRRVEPDAGTGAVLGPFGGDGVPHIADEAGDGDEERRQPAAAQQSDQVLEGQVSVPRRAQSARPSIPYYRPWSGNDEAVSGLTLKMNMFIIISGDA